MRKSKQPPVAAGAKVATQQWYSKAHVQKLLNELSLTEQLKRDNASLKSQSSDYYDRMIARGAEVEKMKREQSDQVLRRTSERDSVTMQLQAVISDAHRLAMQATKSPDAFEGLPHFAGVMQGMLSQHMNGPRQSYVEPTAEEKLRYYENRYGKGNY